MMIISHGAAAVLATKAYTKLRQGSAGATTEQLARVFLFGILPDLPLTILVLAGRFDPEIHYHHRWITHTPVFWLIISAFVMKLYRPRTGLELLMGTWLHLGMDWYGGADGIPFLYPITNQQYGANLSGVNGPEGIRLYLSHPIHLLLEILLQGTLLLIVVRRINRARRA